MGFNYVGDELDVFAYAVNWKRYVASRLAGYLHGDVLEVGAGIGSGTRAFCNGRQQRWVCLEPDPELSERARQSGLADEKGCEFVVGTMASLPPDERFDAILYMDVLEHIEDDRAELARAAQHLKAGGAVCVLAPAHQWLYTPFDEAIGHFRRYTKKTLAAAGPPQLRLERLEYLDSCGLLASAANRFLLHSANPTVQQIVFWDRTLVRSSRVLDPLIGRMAGKSVLAVWRV